LRPVKPTTEKSKNFTNWQLIPGELNRLEFPFWSWGLLSFGFLLILLLILLAYFVRFYRFQIVSNFPEFPSN
tara:strand:+ start:624 stop:839 length:216 start_codon:yes stop_codon:yes gene_type:complete